MHTLFEDRLFYIACDVHPLVKGHILIIPKEHVPCMGALSDVSFSRLDELYEVVVRFINSYRGKCAAFEHGVAGQTVFHAHMHFLPFMGNASDVVPEEGAGRRIGSIEELRTTFKASGKYLFLDDGLGMQIVDHDIAYPRFFRERFAGVLGVKERADWVRAGKDARLVNVFGEEIRELERKWADYAKKSLI